MGVLVVGVCLPRCVQGVYRLGQFAWDLVPAQDRLIGPSGYLGPFLADVQWHVTQPDFWPWLIQVSTPIVGVVLGVLLLRGHRRAAGLIRRTLR